VKVRLIIHDALAEAIRPFGAVDTSIVLERPREASHGDMSSPVAMSLAKQLRRNPIEIAEEIASRLSFDSGYVESVGVLKPGFINFRFAIDSLRENTLDVVTTTDQYGRSDAGGGRKVQVEYVSANPTGPLVIVSARAAAVGSVIVNALRFVGFDAHGEYYVNDYGNQVDKLGESLRYRLRERLNTLPAGAEIGDYPGSYLADVAAGVDAKLADQWAGGAGSASELGAHAAGELLVRIRKDLEAFGVRFDNFFQESSLHEGAIDEVLTKLVDSGNTYQKDGALFFKSSAFGDDKDRVIRKTDGATTYFLADVAYHADKYRRGFERAIELLGPDHHGHIPRMRAAMKVLGAADDWLDVIIVGWVRLMENGELISMSKRAGEFITMRELIDDVGADVAKYFFLMRRANSPLDFDLTLARKHSDENPVYYVQYAHARISSVTRFAREKGASWGRETVDLGLLTEEPERALMLHLLYFSHVVEGAAVSREPHRLTTYAQELATAFHQFYHECRIVSDDAALTSARLLLAEATMQVLRNTLDILGVSAPSSM